MNQLLKWQILYPRMLMAVVALLAVQYGLGRLARSIATGSNDDGVGPRVAASHARVAVLNRQVVLSGLRFENANAPAQRWIEADHAVLGVEGKPLLHKQTVIDRGTVSGLRFGGSADNERPSADPLRSFSESADRRAQEWLERLAQQFGTNWTRQLKSVRLADELCAEWPERSNELQRRMLGLKERASHLQQQADAAQANPLRHQAELHQLPAQVETLRKEFTQVHLELENLLSTLDTHRRAIVAARQHDEQLLRERLRATPPDPSDLTAYLLRRQIARPLDEALDWLRWTRSVAPVNAPARRPARGEDILFVGCRREPQVLIRSLELQGVSRMGGRPVELRGLLTDFTNSPSRHAKPIRLRLKSTGSQPIELQAIIDRTGPTPRDELIVSGSGILLPKLDLGRPEQFGLSLAPAAASLSAHLVARGESLIGDIQIAQKQVQVVPMLSGNLSDVPLAAALNHTLRNAEALAVRVSLSGTLSEPQCTLWSNVGPTVAGAFELALARATDDRVRTLLARAQRQVDERLTSLERAATKQHAALNSQMASATGQLETIAAQQSSRQRLSHEQFGRRLPANSLFR